MAEPVGLPRVGRAAGFRDGSSISRGVGGLQGWHKLGLYHYERLGFQATGLTGVCAAVLLLPPQRDEYVTPEYPLQKALARFAAKGSSFNKQGG